MRSGFESGTATQLKSKGTPTIWEQVWKHRVLTLMVMPAMLYFLIFRYLPIGGLAIAFQDFTPIAGQSFFQNIWESPWVGLKHFWNFFGSLNGPQIILNTFLISIYKLLFAFPLPIILALLLNEVRQPKFKKFVQSVSYLPNFVSWVILAGILRLVLSPDNGSIVPVFKWLGLDVINFFGDTRFFRGLLVISHIWQSVGWDSIIYLAALAGIDYEMYEAARIDGAGRFKQLLYITLPALAPTISIMLILRTGFILDAGFDQVFNLYNPAVYSVANIIDTYVYEQGLIYAQYSYTAAIGLFKSIVGFSMVMATNSFAKRLGQQSIV